MSDRALVVYDGQCRFCLASVASLRRLDWRRRLSYGDARSADVLRENPSIDPVRALARLHLVTPDGARVLDGFHAFRWLAGRLPLLWIAWPVLWLPGMSALGTRVYDWIARNRFAFGTCESGSCRHPAASDRD